MSLVFFQRFFLACLFFSINFEVWDPINSGGYFSLSKLFGGLYFFSVVIKINEFLAIPKKLVGILISIFIFYFILVMSNIVNLGYYYSDIFSTSIFLNILLFLIILNHERLEPGLIERSFVWFLIGAIFSTISYYFGIGVGVEADGRVSLFGDDENALGIRMVIALILLTHFTLKYSKKIHWSLLVLMILVYMPLIDLLFTTGSRVAALSFILVFTLYIFFYKANKIITKTMIIAIFVFSIGFIVDLILKSEVVGKRLMSTKEEGNLAGRDEIWATIWPLIQNNLFLGVGQTGYKDLAYQFFGMHKSPHNVILEVWLYTGILGLCFYLYFLSNCFFQGFKYYLNNKDLVPIVFIVPVLGLILSGQILTLKLGWFILAFCATRKYYLK